MIKQLFSILLSLTILASFVHSNVTITETGKVQKDISETDLVNILAIDSTIKVDLKYTTEDNFVGIDMYKDLDICYLRKEVAGRVSQAQKYLKDIHPNYSLIIYDGLRPRSVQWNMWNAVKGTDMQKYVGNPKNGSIHNYGAAVDLSIVDENGTPIDMGTEFDFLGKQAQPKLESQFLKEGKLTKEHIKNRELLREVMGKAGFINISIEWWHFNAFKVDKVRKRYGIVEEIEFTK